MTSQIKDGKGRGYLAGVDSANRLLVQSSTQSEIGFHSVKEAKSFGIYARAGAVAANTNEGILFMQNQGTNNIIISQITFSVGYPTGTASSSNVWAKYEMFFGTSLATGGSARVPLCLNRGSTSNSIAAAYDGDDNSTTMMTVTGNTSANEFLDVRLNTHGTSTFEFDTRDAMVLAPLTTLWIQAEGSDIGTRFRCNVYYFEETHE